MTIEPTFEDTKAPEQTAVQEAPEAQPGPEPAEAAEEMPYIAPDSAERNSSGFLGGPPTETRARPRRDAFTEFQARTSETPPEAEEAEEEQDDDWIFPRVPRSVTDLGLSKAFLADLTLKILHYSGTPSVSQLTRRLGLPANVMQQLISSLSEERLLEVMTQSDLFTGNYRYRLSERGQVRVAEALERSRYAGPAPVTAEQYNDVMRRVLTVAQDPGRGRIKTILNELTLNPDAADSLARALFSGKATIIYGASGNGKTVVLERFAQNLDGFFLVPYAIYAYGQVIRVFDQSVHEPIDEDKRMAAIGQDPKMDGRWVLCKRPAIVLGAEMGRESLDLAYDPQARFYQAPPHIKAQGGVLVVDDFGRQAIPSRDLLTRWLIPLERGWDTLSLVTGEKLAVPFRTQLLFGTNLPVKKVADDALLRRVLYKVEVPSPTPEEFSEILRQACRQKKVRVEEGSLEYVVSALYGRDDIKVRGSYARDILEMLVESASFDAQEPVLDKASFDRVFKLFIAHETDNGEDAE